MTVLTTTLLANFPFCSIVPGANRHDLVAAEHMALLIHGNQPVAIAVKRHAHIRFMREHGLRQSFGMLGAALIVDVGAVRSAGQCEYLGAEPPKELGRHLVSGAIGAVHDNFQIFQVERPRRVLQEREIQLGRLTDRLDPANGTRDGGDGALPAVDQKFDLRFGFVRELVPAMVKNLDAVIGIRIMRS